MAVAQRDNGRDACVAIVHQSSGPSRLSAEISCAKAEDGVGAIVLGGAGMFDLPAWMEAEHGPIVIDGVGAAATLAAAPIILRRE